jgi:hypothetical protein
LGGVTLNDPVSSETQTGEKQGSKQDIVESAAAQKTLALCAVF